MESEIIEQCANLKTVTWAILGPFCQWIESSSFKSLRWWKHQCEFSEENFKANEPPCCCYYSSSEDFYNATSCVNKNFKTELTNRTSTRKDCKKFVQGLSLENVPFDRRTNQIMLWNIYFNKSARPIFKCTISN